jgi:hypothetical protein
MLPELFFMSSPQNRNLVDPGVAAAWLSLLSWLTGFSTKLCK